MKKSLWMTMFALFTLGIFMQTGHSYTQGNNQANITYNLLEGPICTSPISCYFIFNISYDGSFAPGSISPSSDFLDKSTNWVNGSEKLINITFQFGYNQSYQEQVQTGVIYVPGENNTNLNISSNSTYVIVNYPENATLVPIAQTYSHFDHQTDGWYTYNTTSPVFSSEARYRYVYNDTLFPTVSKKTEYKIKAIGYFKSGTSFSMDLLPKIKIGSNTYTFNELAWFNASFDNRKGINVTNQIASDLIDFQVRHNLTYNANMKADFSDLAFTWLNTSSGNEQSIPHWIENKSNSNWANLWFKVPNVTASSNATVYAYYKNNTPVSDAQNGSATFPIWDDFEYVDTLSNGFINALPAPGNTCSKSTQTGLASPKYIKYNYTSTDHDCEEFRIITFDGAKSLIIVPTRGGQGHAGAGISENNTSLNIGASTQYRARIKARTNTTGYDFAGIRLRNNATLAETDILNLPTIGDYYVNETTQFPNVENWQLGVSAKADLSSGAGVVPNITVDYIFIRKFASTDPTTTELAEENNTLLSFSSIFFNDTVLSNGESLNMTMSYSDVNINVRNWSFDNFGTATTFTNTTLILNLNSISFPIVRTLNVTDTDGNSLKRGISFNRTLSGYYRNDTGTQNLSTQTVAYNITFNQSNTTDLINVSWNITDPINGAGLANQTMKDGNISNLNGSQNIKVAWTGDWITDSLSDFFQDPFQTTEVNATAYITRNLTTHNNFSATLNSMDPQLQNRSGWTGTGQVTSMNIPTTGNNISYAINNSKSNSIHGARTISLVNSTAIVEGISWVTQSISINNTDSSVNYTGARLNFSKFYNISLYSNLSNNIINFDINQTNVTKELNATSYNMDEYDSTQFVSCDAGYTVQSYGCRKAVTFSDRVEYSYIFFMNNNNTDIPNFNVTWKIPTNRMTSFDETKVTQRLLNSSSIGLSGTVAGSNYEVVISTSHR